MPVARAVFDGVLGELPNQLEVLREDVRLMEDAAAAEIARAKVLTLPGYERLP